MVTVTNIAQWVLDKNNKTTGDISLANLEDLIDDAIDYINLEAGTAIADLSGSADTKSLVGTENEITVVKALSALCLRGYKDQGPTVNLGPAGVNAIVSDPHYRLKSMWVKRGINRLRGRSFVRT